MGQVKVVFTGDKTQLEQAYKDLILQNAKLEHAHQRLATKSQEAANTGSKGMDKLTNSTMIAMANMVSLTALAAAANAEFEETLKLQEKIAATNVDVGRAQSKLLFNLAGRDPKEIQSFLGELRKINTDTGFGDVRDLYAAANDALSATGGDMKVSRDIVRAAAPLARGNPQDLRDLSMGAATLQQTLGLTPEQAIAFQSTVGGPSYIKDPAQQARYIPAGIKSGIETLPVKTKEDRIRAAREIGAAMSALGFVAGDTEGMAMRTDIIDLSVELRDFFEKGADVKVGNRTIKKKFGHDPGTFSGRLESLQNNDRARKAFLDQTTSEKQFQVAREQLVTRDGITAKKFREFLPQVSTDPAKYRELADLQAKGTRQIQFSNIDKKGESISQERELADMNADAAKAMAKKIHGETLAKMRQYANAPVGLKYGVESIVGGGQRIAEAIGADPIDMAISDLTDRRRAVTQRRSLLGAESFTQKTAEELTPQNIADRQYIDKQLAILQQLKDLQQQTLDEAKRQTEAMQTQTQPGAEPNAARQEVGRHRE